MPEGLGVYILSALAKHRSGICIRSALTAGTTIIHEIIYKHPNTTNTHLNIRFILFTYNAAHQRRADAANPKHLYLDRAFAACAC